MMNTRYSQQGVTMVGWLIIIMFVMMVGVAVMRLYPLYYDHYLVKDSVEILLKDKSISKNMSEENVRKQLNKQFVVNNITDIDPNTLKVEKKGGKIMLHMEYEARAPFIYNIDFAVRFNDSWVVQ